MEGDGNWGYLISGWPYFFVYYLLGVRAQDCSVLLFLISSPHKNIIFPIFSNGTLIDQPYVNLFHRNLNLVPVLSIEGDEQQTDTRRGRGTFQTVTGAMYELKRKNILYGASVTVTKKNLLTVISPEFVADLKDRGCRVLFYVEYVPVDNKTKDLTPDDQDRKVLD